MIFVWTSARPASVAGVLSCILRREEYQILPPGTLPSFVGRGDVVLCMGGKSVNELYASGLAPKNKGVNALRGKPLFAGGPWFVVTFDPGMVEREADKRFEVRRDAILAKRLADTGTTKPKVGDYQWVETLGKLRAAIEHKHSVSRRPVPVALDLEFMGLVPWAKDKHILTSQWADKAGRCFCVRHDPGPLTGQVAEDIKWLLTTPDVRLWLANGKGDMQWIAEKWGLRCTNFTLDTVVAGSLVNENRRNGLSSHTWDYTEMGGYDDAFDEKHDKANMVQALASDPDGFLTYAGGDGDATYQIGSCIRRELAADPALMNFYREIVHRGARAFELIEERGVVVDTEKLAAVRAVAEDAIREGTTRAMHMISKPIKARYITNLKLSSKRLVCDYLFTPDGLNLSPTVYCDAMLYPGKGFEDDKMPSTAIKDHLSQFRTHPKGGPFIAELEQIGKAEKVRGTYIDGFLEHLREDGRFHPTYCLHKGALYDKGPIEAGTVTGRTSAKGPAIQTNPKHGIWAKRLRKCYVAPDGYWVWQMDYSQGELRVTACVAPEPTMLEVYRHDIDLHAKTAAEANGIDVEEFLSWKDSNDKKLAARFEELRQGGKAGNFGLIYGMGAKGFMEYAWKSYGVLMTLEEAQDFRDQFFETYPALVGWHTRIKKIARRDKQVRSPLGRIRHLPQIDSSDSEVSSKAERQAINSPVQSALSDLCVDVAATVEEEYPDQQEFLIVGMTHDSLNGYVRQGQEREWLGRIAKIAATRDLPGRFGWHHQLPFPVDVEYGPNMAEMTKVALDA